VSDQGLRTAVVVGRPALGMPDWRGERAAHPLSSEDVADVVAWLIEQRPLFPGQPYPAPIPTRGRDDG
jgi:cytochrome c oxidase cbb3-type subunit 3/ubiquinol-cytochrome c reductase cytochrome c subunit